jgi:hypothetical protein
MLATGRDECILEQVLWNILLDTTSQENGTSSMQRTPIPSTQLRSVGYDAATQTLEVEFTSGEISCSVGVPENTYRDLMSASSHGQYCNAHKNGGR